MHLQFLKTTICRKQFLPEHSIFATAYASSRKNWNGRSQIWGKTLCSRSILHWILCLVAVLECSHAPRKDISNCIQLHKHKNSKAQKKLWVFYWVKMFQWWSDDRFSFSFSSLLRISRKVGLLFISIAQHCTVKLQTSHVPN